jgi:hypothetical protein
MKTLLIFAHIFVATHGKQIKLSQSNIVYLMSHGTNTVKNTLFNYRYSGTIRNNEAADQIFILLNK